METNIEIFEKAQAELHELNALNTDLMTPEQYDSWERAVGLAMLIILANSSGSFTSWWLSKSG